MCLACIEGELWATYQSEMAMRAATAGHNDEAQHPTTADGEPAAARAGSRDAPVPPAGATEPIPT